MAETRRAHFVFTVKEYADGTSWIMLEPLDKKASELFPNGFIGFDLPEGTSVSKADDIAEYMRENLSNITITTY